MLPGWSTAENKEPPLAFPFQEEKFFLKIPGAILNELTVTKRIWRLCYSLPRNHFVNLSYGPTPYRILFSSLCPCFLVFLCHFGSELPCGDDRAHQSSFYLHCWVRPHLNGEQGKWMLPQRQGLGLLSDNSCSFEDLALPPQSLWCAAHTHTSSFLTKDSSWSWAEWRLSPHQHFL